MARKIKESQVDAKIEYSSIRTLRPTTYPSFMCILTLL